LPPLLSIIIVNWNVRELLRACLHSIVRARGNLDLELIVVDSASGDGSVAMLNADFPTVRLIGCEQNVGFSAGNNLGIAAAAGELLLCLNPDTEIVGDALQTLTAYLQANPAVGVVGPQLLYADGSVQSTRRRFPTLATALLESTSLQRWFPRNRVLARYYVADRPDDAVQQVDWLMGACFMLRRHIVAQVGAFDEQFFMYSEELDWMKRIHSAGWQIVYLPAAKVIHHEGKSSEQVAPLRHLRFLSSRIRYFRKHHGQLASGIVWWFLIGMTIYQMLEESAKWLVGHKRPLRRQRIAACWLVLRSGLRA
jgi:N-acetylglucosaminyl-diphospho-decaprenol L-rhamnosyltransferase